MEGLLRLDPLISGVGKPWEDCQEFLQNPHFLRGCGLSLRVLRGGGTEATSEEPARLAMCLASGTRRGASRRDREEMMVLNCIVIRRKIKSGKPPGGNKRCSLFKEEKISSGETLETCVFRAVLHSSEIILNACIFSASQSIFVPL